MAGEELVQKKNVQDCNAILGFNANGEICRLYHVKMYFTGHFKIKEKIIINWYCDWTDFDIIFAQTAHPY